ncbi:oligosaccharide flippase family protein [Rufibacter sp. LB8]|uniref:lipopolysaccharide biosynthesis protein n=1 Tax=Rufibacter sp. LB8 TaxID=2777781 RepID=UPI00178C616D
MIKKIAANKHVKNVSWNVAEAVLYPAALLVATPIYLSALGDELYGLWTLMTSIIVSIGVVNGGLADTTIKYISKYRALQDHATAQRIFRTTLTWTLLIALAILCLSPVLSYGIVTFDLFEIPNSLTQSTILYLNISFITLAFKLIEQIFYAYYKAYERFDVFSKASIAVKVGTIVLNVLLLLAGYGLLAVLLSTLVLSFLLLILVILKTGHETGFKQLMPLFDKNITAELQQFTKWSWLQTVIGVANSQMDKFLVASLVSLEMLAYYSIGLMVVNQIHMVLTTAASTVFPLISRMEAKNETTDTLFLSLQKLVTVAGMLIILHLHLVKEFVFTAWLGPEIFQRSSGLLFYFFAYLMVASTSVMPNFYLLGSGKIKENALSLGFNALVTVAAMLALFAVLGVEGLVIGKALALFLTITLVFLYLKKTSMPHLSAFSLFQTLLLCLAGIAVLAVDQTWLTVAIILYLYYLVVELVRKNSFAKKLFARS